MLSCCACLTCLPTHACPLLPCLPIATLTIASAALSPSPSPHRPLFHRPLPIALSSLQTTAALAPPPHRLLKRLRAYPHTRPRPHTRRPSPRRVWTIARWDPHASTRRLERRRACSATSSASRGVRGLWRRRLLSPPRRSGVAAQCSLQTVNDASAARAVAARRSPHHPRYRPRRPGGSASSIPTSTSW